MRLQGKTILVTAAGQGIGRACALAMAREGATVWATDLKQELLDAYAGVPNITTHILDVLKTPDVDAFAKKSATSTSCLIVRVSCIRATSCKSVMPTGISAWT